MAYLEQHIQADRVVVEWECAKCRTKNASIGLDISTSGGCSGHPEGGYCYCGPTKFTYETRCDQCDIYTTIHMPGSGF